MTVKTCRISAKGFALLLPMLKIFKKSIIVLFERRKVVSDNVTTQSGMEIGFNGLEILLNPFCSNTHIYSSGSSGSITKTYGRT